MTDAQLATLSQQGDQAAFGELARRWDQKLFRFLHRMLGNEEEARDTCQEALLRAYLKIGSLREPAHFKTWLHSIAVNLCRDRGRSDRRRQLHEVHMDHVAVVEPPSPAATPADAAEQRDLAAVLRRQLARLPEDQRTAIVLREYEGFTSQEIAAVTGTVAATVRSRIFYGLKGLRRMMEEAGVSLADLTQNRSAS